MILALALGATGCATRPPEPLTRDAVTLPQAVRLPAPPQAVTLTCNAVELNVFDADSAEQLADYILAAERLNAQVAAYRTSIERLDTEAAALLRVANAKRAELHLREQALRRERWTWRLGAAALGVLAVGVAAQ